MASYNKFQDYVEQVNRGVHLWHSHTFKAALTNTAPVATQVSFDAGTDHPPPAAANGYPSGGMTLDGVTLSEASGTAKVVVTDEVLTATAGGIGPFRYVPHYNDTATSPADALVCWFDYGSSITLLDTETFTLDYDPTNGLWQMV